MLTDALIAESLKGRGGDAPVWTQGAGDVNDDPQTDKT